MAAVAEEVALLDLDVCGPGTSSCSLLVQRTWTVRQVKEFVAAETGTPSNEQALFLGAVELHKEAVVLADVISASADRAGMGKGDGPVQLKLSVVLAAKQGRGNTTLADALGFSIVLGAALYKLPQVIHIQQARSARGLSLISVAAEAVGSTLGFAYSASQGHPISTYGETLAQLIAGMVIVLQILRYEHRKSLQMLGRYLAGGTFTAMVACRGWILLGDEGRQATLRAMKLGEVLLALGARIPQVLANWRASSAGELSLATNMLGLVGCLVRGYTVFAQQLAGDTLMVASVVASVLSNSVLVAQILVYNARATRARR